MADGRAVRVLLVDDDEKLNTLLVAYLGRFNISVRAVVHPDEALQVLDIGALDLVILDVMLPDVDGFALCRRIRRTSRVPIIMLTARGDVRDRIAGLELGADDYLSKPFEPRELRARMQAVLRRGTGSTSDDVVRMGALEINMGTQTVRLASRSVELTAAEFELLGLLVRHRGRVLTRDRIMDETHGIDLDAYDRSIDVLVSRIRQKLGDDPRQATFIRTVRGVGYLFVGADDA